MKQPQNGAESLTVLLTGFGPFPGAPFNPTGALVRQLANMRRPAFAAIRRVGHVFRTSYGAVDAELPRLIEECRPDVLLMFGLAARTKFLRIETRARNARSGLLPDAAGALPMQRGIAAGAPSELPGRAPFEALRIAGRGRVPVRLSHNAGRYLCNYLYWRAMELNGPTAPRLIAFVHVPLVRRGPRPRATRAAPPTTDELVRAATAILRVLVTAARRR
jgi:pyroglutamyl-peptidase